MTIRVQNSQGVTSVTIDRPEVRNALNEHTVQELNSTFLRLAHDPLCRVIILSGEGNRAFCAGADLTELEQKHTLEEKQQFFSGIAALVTTMSECPKPIIAKVHGAAVAGGLGLVAASDLVYAADDASFSLPEIKIGLGPLIVMTPLERSLPRKILADLALTGEVLTATRALALGFVSRLFPSSELDAGVQTIAEQLARANPEALVAIKRSLYSIAEGSYFELLKSLPSQIATLSMGERGREGVKNFVANRNRSSKSQQQ